MIEKPQYVLSYSRDNSIPNWVSWHVSKNWLDSAPRQDDFRTDESLPASWYRVSPSSFTGSGFDRGHNCPSADRTRSIEDNSATFLMNNIIPQDSSSS
ncbi:DNA/RNA non-specific endonuclease [Adhaeribacter arboris]|uniref:DNA/RNA non-specific endonuclease n=1 Tax=Adhaeribacter arboris TaxID=2072846 RepID=UPI0021CF923A|nr:DNA/RNA non-specific endonuclease [Adhaeribacter arboris]